MAKPTPGLVFLTGVQVACSVLVAYFTSNRLISTPFGSRGPSLCYLSDHADDSGFCDYALVVSAFSVAVAILAGFIRCVSLDCCGLGPLASIVLAAVNCIWWLVAAIVFTAASAAADAAKLPASSARHVLLAAAWTGAVSEFAHTLLACVVVGNNICNIIFCVPALPGHQDDCCEESCSSCCGGCCCCSRGRHNHHHQHGHTAHGEPLLQPATAAAATLTALSLKKWWGMMQQEQQRPGPLHHQPNPASSRPPAAWSPAATTIGQVPGMPLPPTPGQPYVVMPPSAHGGPAPGHAPPAAGSFAGFATSPGLPAPTPPGFSTAPPAEPAAAAPSAPPAPYAPPMVLQQQQQHPGLFTAPGVASMDDSTYPSISKS